MIGAGTMRAERYGRLGEEARRRASAASGSASTPSR